MKHALLVLSTLLSASAACAQSCIANETTLCVQGDRFSVTVQWRDQATNLSSVRREDAQGMGLGTQLADDAGWFTFDDPQRPELLVNVLDGRPINGAFWVFSAAPTTRFYQLTVTDTVTEASATYFNPLGTLATSVADTQAFVVDAAKNGVAVRNQVPSSRPMKGQIEGTPCEAAPDRVCLVDGRFAVDVEYLDFNDIAGTAFGTGVAGDVSAAFSRFEEGSPEIIVNIHDGALINGQYWVAAAALTNIEFTITVTDLQTGEERSFFNPLGNVPTAFLDYGALGTSINTGHAGFWFDEATPGQGLALELYPAADRFAFLAFYGFEPASAKLGASDQRWFTGQGQYNDDTATLTLYSTSGGAFDDEQATQTVEIGSAQFVVGDCTRAALNYDIPEDGISGTVALARLVPAADGIEDLCEFLSLGGQVEIP